MEGLRSILEKPGYDEQNLYFLKLMLALVALTAVLVDRWRRQEGRPISRRWQQVVGATLAVCSVVAYAQFFQIGYREYYHRWDFFHAYLGAKYHEELRYERFYGCVAVAESELPDGSAAPNDRPRQDIKTRQLRDLRANLIVETTGWLEHPERCKEAFQDAGGQLREERWAEFRGDVAFFRRAMWGNYWRDAQKDHGYNLTPGWVLLATPLTWRPASTEWLQVLAALDPLLLSTTFGLIAWAFGWRTLCLTLVVWGTSPLWPFYWMGGALLRHEWVFCLVSAVCLARRRQPGLAGALLGLGAMTRFVPFAFLLGPCVLLVSQLVRRVPGWRRTRRLLGGFALSVTVLFVATERRFGPDAWPEGIAFLLHSDGTALTNKVSWRAFVGYDPQTRMQLVKAPHLVDPFGPWKQARSEKIRQHPWVRWGGVLLGLGAIAVASWRARSLWVALALGAAAPFWLSDLPTYFSAYLLPLALLRRARPGLDVPWLLFAVIAALCPLLFGWFDMRFSALSAVVAVIVVTCLASVLWPRPRWAQRRSRFFPARPAHDYREAAPPGG